MKRLISKMTGAFKVYPDYSHSLRNTLLVIVLLAIGAVLSTPFSVMNSMHGISGFLPLHMFLETFAIVVALLIFAIGWQAQSRNPSGNFVLLACAFLGVGLLDFAHMLSYAGMPDFVTPANPEKGIDFWLVARSLAAIALLAVAILPWRPYSFPVSRYAWLAATLAATALAYWLILFHQDEMPRTYIPGKGLTAFKIASEYALITINVATALILLRQMRKPQPYNIEALFGAVCVMALSEYLFTRYASVTDIFNLLGHVYKAIAYLLLYRAFVAATVEIPFRQLLSSETRLRTLYESTSDAVMLVGEQGFLDCNRATLALFGCDSKEEFCSKHPADISPPRQPCGGDSRVLSEQNNATAIREGRHSFEWVCQRVDNKQTFIASVLLNCMELEGRRVLQATVRDITERKLNEAKIERLSRAYRLLSRVNEAIVRAKDRAEIFATICKIADESELFRLVWIGMLDGQRNSVIPVAYSGAESGYMSNLNIRLDDKQTGNGPIANALRANRPYICQDIEHDPRMAPWQAEALKRGYRASGAFPICETGIATGVIAVYAPEPHFFSQDIVHLMLELAADVSFSLDVFAEKRRREQAEDEIRKLNAELEYRIQERTRQLEAANRELESFSYSVSHDLRAPLRSIDGFSKVLLNTYRDRLDETGKEWLERVRRASQHMGTLIDDMLQLSHVSRGELKRRRIDLGEVATSVVSELRLAYPERQVRFSVHDDLVVHADYGLMRAAMVNLLGNAWKYTGKKIEAEIEFGVCVMPSGTGTERAFFVRDNGAGFSMEYEHKLFGPFQRLHGSNEFEGTGIGLATVQRIIHRHHGKVWAVAEEDRGATFYFTLPQRDLESRGRNEQ